MRSRILLVRRCRCQGRWCIRPARSFAHQRPPGCHSAASFPSVAGVSPAQSCVINMPYHATRAAAWDEGSRRAPTGSQLRHMSPGRLPRGAGRAECGFHSTRPRVHSWIYRVGHSIASCARASSPAAAMRCFTGRSQIGSLLVLIYMTLIQYPPLKYSWVREYDFLYI
eukprot:SAG31_NODE_6263_length_2097_cov_1.129129_1_plen_168_part_00